MRKFKCTYVGCDGGCELCITFDGDYEDQGPCLCVVAKQEVVWEEVPVADNEV